eukprot:TRINITY_DN4368_c0_g7_i1.p1 TRINITY_DN4368_c0_g7~~TRINITY_DN4368_c0_g7_i1.p1  ORF type:complete len:946 (+),score=134.53 TRINITY_DN4368_c0_g7_i1:76-2913(+)
MKLFILLLIPFTGVLSAKVDYGNDEDAPAVIESSEEDPDDDDSSLAQESDANGWNHAEVIAKLPKCKVGYNRTKKNNYRCADINECSHYPLHNCSLGHPCVNTEGSFFCRCPAGYGGSFPRCQNVDECKTGAHTCKLHENYNTGVNCSDTVGSFICKCLPGYAPRVFPNYTHLNCSEVNECLAGNHNCDTQGGNCTDTVGSFTCKCKPGYLGDGVTCVAIDECVMGIHNCAKDAECADTAGSFTCQCKVGFAGNGTYCIDIDECNATLRPAITLNISRGVRAGTHGCDQNLSRASCFNTAGSYLCACKDGWEGTGKTCVNMNECDRKIDNCTAKKAICTDTVGSYTCACDAGFKMANGTDGPNGTCIDIDECLINALARGNGTTTTTTGPYGARALLLQAKGKAETAVDADYAMWHAAGIPDKLCAAKGDCINNAGSFICQCRRGYVGDGMSCVDTNECKTGAHNCDVRAHCLNTEGSFKCACLPGYNGSGTSYSGGWPPIDGCWDIDECTNATQLALRNITNISKVHDWTNISACVKGGVCVNSVGSYSCKCGPGYKGDGLNCTDINECTALDTSKHNCPTPNSWCNNTDGSYQCVCNVGFVKRKYGEGVQDDNCVSRKRVEVGAATMQLSNLRKSGWQTVKFQSEFLYKPVVVVQAPLVGAREIYPRVKGITRFKFEVAISFANTTNGTEDGFFYDWINSTLRTINYFAAVPGLSQLPNGTVVSAGYMNGMQKMKRSSGCKDEKTAWKKIDLLTNFTRRPVLLAQIQDLEPGLTNWKGGGMERGGNFFCTHALRWNWTLNETANPNNSAFVGRTCVFAEEMPSDDTMGWIAIGSNVSNTSNSVFLEYDVNPQKRVNYVSVIDERNITGNGEEETSDFNQTFAKGPIVFANKVSTNKAIVGRLQFAGADGTKAFFRNVEDETCEIQRRKQEYFNMFVAATSFSV